jgi:hypothetical protein
VATSLLTAVGTEVVLLRRWRSGVHHGPAYGHVWLVTTTLNLDNRSLNFHRLDDHIFSLRTYKRPREKFMNLDDRFFILRT